MPLPDPQLDDRRFQDLVDEAKRLIPRYTPEWTDHNVSDPGVTLIELFAWMTDLTLYRLNRVPEKSYLRFMELLGVTLKEPVPARTLVSLWLSAPQPGAITISGGTAVATVRTGDQQATAFTTDEPIELRPPEFQSLLATGDDVDFRDLTGRLGLPGERINVFQTPPLPGEALYLRFETNVSRHVLRMRIECEIEGIGVDPDDPPLSWEAWGGERRGWLGALVELDETGGLNTTGNVLLHVPDGLETRTITGQEGFWVRVRVVQPREGQPTYAASPQIGQISVDTIGGTVPATHSTVVINELLDRGTGVPGMTQTLQYTPILPRRDDEYLEIQEESEGPWIQWEEVTSFETSGPDDRHYTLDSVTGILSFGPTIRDARGIELPHGKAAPRGAAMRFVRYRQGGGVHGNVGANTLTVLKSSIPYVARVSNLAPAIGGLDAESLEAAKQRVPQMLRAQGRAVTAADYEHMAMEASREVARVKCIQSRTGNVSGSVPPGTVELLVVGALPDDQERTLDAMQPGPALLQQVREYLDERRLLGTQLVVDGPAFIGVSIEAAIVVERGRNPEAVRDAVVRRLNDYIDPYRGGAAGLGWPFGQDLYLAEVQSLIEAVPGVEFARDVTLFQVDTTSNQAVAAGQQVTLAEDVLILPYENHVSIVERGR